MELDSSEQGNRPLEDDKIKEKESSPKGVLEVNSPSLKSKTNSSHGRTSSGSETQSTPPEVEPSRRWFFGLIRESGSSKLHSKSKVSRKKDKRFREDIIPDPKSSLEVQLSGCFKSSWKSFSLSQLKSATNNFNRGNISYLI